MAHNDPDDMQTFRLLTETELFFFFLLYLQQTIGLDNLKRNILKRYSDLDYDSFVGLMGRRNAGEFSTGERSLIRISSNDNSNSINVNDNKRKNKHQKW